jgi:GT2 family glycosyltransferase
VVYDRWHRQAISEMEHTPAGSWTIWGGNFSVGRDTFFKVGGFDAERFHDYGGEDTDFGLRAAAAGVPMVLAREALARHLRECDYASPPATGVQCRPIAGAPG